MAVAVDVASAAANNVTSVSSVTWSHTCGASATMLVVQSGYVRVGNSPISTVTYNSVSCTLGVNSYPGNNVHASNYYLTSPSTGSAFNIVVTYPDSSTFEPKCGAISFTGTETTFTGATATGGAAGTNPSTGVSITTNADNSMVANAIGDNGGLTSAVDTQQWININGAGGMDGGGSTRTTTTAGSYSMSWNGAGSDNWAVAMMEIKESSSGGSAYRGKALLGVGR